MCKSICKAGSNLPNLPCCSSTILPAPETTTICCLWYALLAVPDSASYRPWAIPSLQEQPGIWFRINIAFRQQCASSINANQPILTPSWDQVVLSALCRRAVGGCEWQSNFGDIRCCSELESSRCSSLCHQHPLDMSCSLEQPMQLFG